MPFGQDFYFKYGRSAPFLADASTPLPDNNAMPFTRVQQRYEAYNKYVPRVIAGIRAFTDLKGDIKAGTWKTIQKDDPKYAARPMGLLANGLMASENTSPANVLFLTRWYINEFYLDIGDIAKAPTADEAMKSWNRGRNALNSVIIILNKNINAKVGDQLPTI